MDAAHQGTRTLVAIIAGVVAVGHLLTAGIGVAIAPAPDNDLGATGPLRGVQRPGASCRGARRVKDDLNTDRGSVSAGLRRRPAFRKLCATPQLCAVVTAVAALDHAR